jgi:uncharacterized protein YjbI with pentapeptide repeats
MYFPLIERRTSSQDRRSQTLERRKSQDTAILKEKREKSIRRKKTDRRVLTLDRETLLYASFLNTPPQSIYTDLNNNSKPVSKKSKTLSFCSAILIPLTIGLSSLGATFFINDKQIESAKLLADEQEKSANTIANANIKNSQTIANAQMKTQHLQHLVSIFSTIISSKLDGKPKVIRQHIQSLAVYGDDSIPFLLQIKDHFPESKNTALHKTTLKTIDNIIGHSQFNLSKQKIGESSGAPLNLRHRDYSNYNLDESHFTNVVLYKSNFSGSSLQDSTFKDTDLQEANFISSSLINVIFNSTYLRKTNFHQANLKGSIFKKSNLQGASFKDSNLTDVTFDGVNLKETDFHQAYLEGVRFLNCTNIEEARFSLSTILKAQISLFGSLDEEKYILILLKHRDKLIDHHNKDKNKLDNILKILKITDFITLQNMFEQLQNRNVVKIKEAPILSFLGFNH